MIRFCLKVLIACCLCLLFSSCGLFIDEQHAGNSKSTEISGVIPLGIQNGKFDPFTQEILFSVNHQGLYELCPQNLPDYDWMNFKFVEILNRTNIVQHWVANKNNYACLRFYSENDSGNYSVKNYYRLVVKNDKSTTAPVQELPSASEDHPGYPPIFYYDYSENNTYEPTYFDTEPWFWRRLTQKESASININLSKIPGKLKGVSLNLWAKTEHPITNSNILAPHQISIKFNNLDEMIFKFTGKEKKLLIDFPENLANQPTLDITFKIITDGELLGDIIYLDTLTVFTNPGENLPESGAFIGKNGYVKIRGGNNLAILERTEDRITQIYTVPNNSSSFFWLPTLENYHYFIFSEQEILHPDEVMIIDTNFAEKDLEGADYLMIGDEQFQGSAKTLLEYREQQGFETRFVNIQSVFNQFGYGYPEPEALRAYLTYALTNWEVKPKYVLLLGDYTFDPKNYLKNESRNSVLLPSSFIYTQFGGWTLSDPDMFDTDRDSLMDISSGRIPVNQPDELDYVIDKIIEYEKRINHSSSDENITLIIDDGDQSIRSSYGELNRNFLLLNDNQKTPIRELVHREFNNATLPVTFYLGHGSLRQLGRGNIYDVNDIQKNNQPDDYGTLFLFTCLSGYFAHPEAKSLAEETLLSPNTSISALFGPTSLTLPADQSGLVNNFADEILNSSTGLRIGDLIRNASKNYLSSEDPNLDILFTFMLFGDPAMILK